MPVTVILSYLAKIFFNVRDLDKNSVFCLQFLLLERPPLSYMNGDPPFLFLYFSDHMHIQYIS